MNNSSAESSSVCLSHSNALSVNHTFPTPSLGNADQTGVSGISPTTYTLNFEEGRDECEEITLYFSFNEYARNKYCPSKELLTTGFKDTEGTIQDFAAYRKKGYALNGAWFGGQRRCNANVNRIGLAMVDIDQTDLTWEQLINLPVCVRYANYAYTTPSHTDKDTRARIVFRLPDGVDAETYRAIILWLFDQIPGYDSACKDPGRIFYGNTDGKEHFYPPENIIPQDVINECREKARQEQETQAIAREKQREWLESQNPEDTERLAIDALYHIPPRGKKGSGTYPDALLACFATCAIYGLDRAYPILEAWSPTDLENGWDIDKIVNDYDPDRGIGAGTLFYLA